MSNLIRYLVPVVLPNDVKPKEYVVYSETMLAARQMVKDYLSTVGVQQSNGTYEKYADIKTLEIKKIGRSTDGVLSVEPGWGTSTDDNRNVF